MKFTDIVQHPLQLLSRQHGSASLHCLPSDDCFVDVSDDDHRQATLLRSLGVMRAGLKETYRTYLQCSRRTDGRRLPPVIQRRERQS